MTKKSAPFQDYQIEWLKDPANAAEYLSAAIEDGDRQAFLLALRNVAEARGGIAAVARLSGITRESLYRMLSSRGNPEIKSLVAIMRAMGLAITVTPESKHKQAA